MKKWIVDMGKRFGTLLIKVVSVKGLILGLATWLTLKGTIGATEWMICALGLAGARAYEKAHVIVKGGSDGR